YPVRAVAPPLRDATVDLVVASALHSRWWLVTKVVMRIDGLFEASSNRSLVIDMYSRTAFSVTPFGVSSLPRRRLANSARLLGLRTRRNRSDNLIADTSSEGWSASTA